MSPKILVCGIEGSKDQIWTKNWVCDKYLKNFKLDFFDLVREVRPFLASYVACYQEFFFGDRRSKSQIWT